MGPGDSVFKKSLRNQGVEREALTFLRGDPRIQVVGLATKRAILELIGANEAFGIQTFDAVMTPTPAPILDVTNIESAFGSLRLLEVKSTRKPIRDANLNGFFFGATEREYAMADALGEKYLFAFVVLSSRNDYGRPFAVLLPLHEVERRTRSRRVQYQVNFRTDLTPSTPEVGVLLDHRPSAEPAT